MAFRSRQTVPEFGFQHQEAREQAFLMPTKTYARQKLEEFDLLESRLDKETLLLLCKDVQRRLTKAENALEREYLTPESEKLYEAEKEEIASRIKTIWETDKTFRRAAAPLFGSQTEFMGALKNRTVPNETIHAFLCAEEKRFSNEARECLPKLEVLRDECVAAIKSTRGKKYIENTELALQRVNFTVFGALDNLLEGNDGKSFGLLKGPNTFISMSLLRDKSLQGEEKTRETVFHELTHVLSDTQHEIIINFSQNKGATVDFDHKKSGVFYKDPSVASNIWLNEAVTELLAAYLRQGKPTAYPVEIAEFWKMVDATGVDLKMIFHAYNGIDNLTATEEERGQPFVDLVEGLKEAEGPGALNLHAEAVKINRSNYKPTEETLQSIRTLPE